MDNGIFIDDSYVVAGSYERPEIYDGVTLPDEEAEEEYVFRLQVAEAPVNSPDETAGSTQWLTLPADRTEADRLARAHNEDCIEDCVYYGFESAIPQITSEMFGDMLEFDTLNKLAAHIAEMSDMEQVTFKAALTAEKPQGIREALDIAEHLQEYELSYYTNAPAAFFKNYLQHYLDTRFDGRWLDMLPAQKEGEQLLGRLGATDTEYGVISARGHSLYEPVLREEPEAKKLKTQALTDEKLDVIEVLGRRRCSVMAGSCRRRSRRGCMPMTCATAMKKGSSFPLSQRSEKTTVEPYCCGSCWIFGNRDICPLPTIPRRTFSGTA